MGEMNYALEEPVFSLLTNLVVYVPCCRYQKFGQRNPIQKKPGLKQGNFNHISYFQVCCWVISQDYGAGEQKGEKATLRALKKILGGMKGTATVLIGAGISASLRGLYNIC